MSNPLTIRDAIFTRLATNVGAPFMGLRTKRRTPLPTLTENELPALSVFVLAEDGMPDGQGNQGAIKFINDASIGVSVTRAFSDPLLLQGQLDADMDLIKSTLLTDASFTKMGPSALFESVEKVRRTWVEHPDGEAYSAELRLEMTFRYREDWAPIIPDELEVIHVTTAFPDGGTPAQQAAVQQVVAEYDIPQN